MLMSFFFFFQAEDGIRDKLVTGVQTCALPIWKPAALRTAWRRFHLSSSAAAFVEPTSRSASESCLFVGKRSEEHTSELQSLAYLVCRLLLEKKKKSIQAM